MENNIFIQSLDSPWHPIVTHYPNMLCYIFNHGIKTDFIENYTKGPIYLSFSLLPFFFPKCA